MASVRCGLPQGVDLGWHLNRWPWLPRSREVDSFGGASRHLAEQFDPSMRQQTASCSRLLQQRGAQMLPRLLSRGGSASRVRVELPFRQGTVGTRKMSRTASASGLAVPREVFGDDHAAWRETCTAFFRDQVGPAC